MHKESDVIQDPGFYYWGGDNAYTGAVVNENLKPLKTTEAPAPALAYDPSFDLLYLQEFKKGKLNLTRQELDLYIQRQLATNLSERFDMPLSVTKYEIKDGQIYGQNTDLPFSEMIKRGIDYRRTHGNPADFLREEAELTGFLKIQKVLADPKTPLGTVMISVSPRGGDGSSYQHNFLDGMEVRQDQSGVRFVEAIRYSSSLTRSEFSQKMNALGKVKSYDLADDVYFLSNPLRFEGISRRRIQEGFGKKEGGVTQEEFNFILQASAPVWENYKTALFNLDFENVALSFNAGLNIADEALDIYRGKIVFALRPDNLDELINIYGRRQVKGVTAGCGFSGGVDVAGGPQNPLLQSSPFSVSEFNTAYTGENAKNDPGLCKCGNDAPHFHCPGKEGVECGHKIIVGKGVSSCPSCGAGKIC